MLITIPDVLTAEEVAQARAILDAAEWVDGKVTAGYQAQSSQREPSVAGGTSGSGRSWVRWCWQHWRDRHCSCRRRSPSRCFRPCSTGTPEVGTLEPMSIRRFALWLRQASASGPMSRQRCFFTPPDQYDGGELIVEDTYGLHSVKLPAGHMVLYPATSLHRVTPVTRGARVSSFFWIQSMIRTDGDRTLLYDLDTAIQRLAKESPGNPIGVQLTGVYHNLLRRWAEM